MEKFWAGKRVLVTGHTGFKGGWLSYWLQKKGARVFGFSLPPNNTSLFYHSTNLGNFISDEIYSDVQHYENVKKVVSEFQPEVVFT